MRFREDLLTETVLQQTLDALRSGPPNPEALLERSSEVDYLSITYLYNSTNIIEGFRLRSVVQHRQAILELERFGSGGGKRESRVVDLEAKFDHARKALCNFLENAKYAK